MKHEDMAAALRAAGWRVQQPLTKENCPHYTRRGSGAMAADGSGYCEFYCPECGLHSRTDYPANPNYNSSHLMLQNA